ncbi:glycine zipper 2TM domain-containing protein [Ferrovibrio sp.]|uniref:glycine zipper 2TM domain-containing protein n=1 Tax=Ferrovibrio sp. TaxID=1917215 RepID=UPI0025C4C35E|nr:glycine zipper 2TM domain-containing protein [Ferrovibrio sp.]MBX3455165.1 glycine zipper 2TM domain-containing protein [Ferrovibrio sp.]
MDLRAPAVAMAALMFLAACQHGQMSDETKCAIGGIGGAVLGGLIGAKLGGKGDGRVVGAALGAGAGGMLGCQFVMMLSKREREDIDRSTRQALASAPTDRNDSISWRSPETAASGTINMAPSQPASALPEAREAVSANKLPANAICRQVRTDVQAGAQTASDGTLYCRSAQGDWLPVAKQATG